MAATRGVVGVGGAAPQTLADQVATLRARGVNAVQLRRIEAMASRAESHAGLARQLLDQRLQQLLQPLLQTLLQPLSQHSSQHPSQHSSQAAVNPDTTTVQHGHSTPLADLLRHIQHQSAAGAADAGSNTGAAQPRAVHGRGPAPPELKAIRNYRDTWSRLNVERRLSQALSQVPDNAGPLNTQRLLHQALAAMGEASAPYLQRFMVHVEALLWLDQLTPPAAATPKKLRLGNSRKPG